MKPFGRFLTLKHFSPHFSRLIVKEWRKSGPSFGRSNVDGIVDELAPLLSLHRDNIAKEWRKSGQSFGRSNFDGTVDVFSPPVVVSPSR